MQLQELHSLLVILCIAAVAPVLCEWVPRIRLPLVVAEIAMGIVVGPQVLGWAESGPVIQVLSNFGLGFLFFLTGFEIDFPSIQGRPLLFATIGWLASLAVCLSVGLGLQACGVVDSGLIVGAALATTALGTLMPILRDANELPTRFGAYAVASGAIGELGPIILIALLLSPGEGERGIALVFMVVFTAIIVAGACVALNFRPPRVILLLQKKMHTSAQLPVRLAILVLASLVILARNLGLDAILGALAAGVVVALASPGKDGEELRHKLEGIGFGFFVPIFFVTTGLRYELHAMISSRLALLQLPMFLGLFLVVRGLPALRLRRELDLRSRIALALLSATQLPLVIAIAEVGVKSGRLNEETSASLVGAGMVSVLLFPIAALALRRADVLRQNAGSEVATPETSPAGVVPATGEVKGVTSESGGS
jgi:Kef-type K+ transport system membrane component KefB